MTVITDTEKLTCIKHTPGRQENLHFGHLSSNRICRKDHDTTVRRSSESGPKDEQMTPSFFNYLLVEKRQPVFFCNAV